MKEYIDKYREFKKNRRAVGFTKLGFWIIFFGIMFLLYALPSGNPKPVSSPTNEPKEDENVVSSYAFDYTINEQKYSGLYDGNTELIGENYSFYITRDKILMDNEEAVLPDYTYTNIHKLDALVDESDLDYTKSYKDGKEEYKYINTKNNSETTITYIKNIDGTIDAHLEYNDTIIDVHYYDINKTKITLDEKKYIYELKEVEDEH